MTQASPHSDASSFELAAISRQTTATKEGQLRACKRAASSWKRFGAPYEILAHHWEPDNSRSGGLWLIPSISISPQLRTCVLETFNSVESVPLRELTGSPSSRRKILECSASLSARSCALKARSRPSLVAASRKLSAASWELAATTATTACSINLRTKSPPRAQSSRCRDRGPRVCPP
jgi:hypothetical protein